VYVWTCTSVYVSMRFKRHKETPTWELELIKICCQTTHAQVCLHLTQVWHEYTWTKMATCVKKITRSTLL
jgi:hypothetical protein